MKSFFRVAASAFLGFALCAPVIAQDTETKTTILITNANIFNGSDQLVTGMSVLVEGNKIAKIARSK